MEALERIAQGLFFTRSKMFLNHSPERHLLGKSIIPPPNFATHHMPYCWTSNDLNTRTVLTLWPHRSLPRRGFAAIILLAFALGTIPLYGLLGSVALWGILPFILIVVGALWWGLERSYRDGDILEDLCLDNTMLTLTHRPARGAVQQWDCNVYWARCELHAHGGPVPHYVTLTGNGRTVELGSFLSEDERKNLFSELNDFLCRYKPGC